MTGSGILPTTIYKNRLYFLFGRENNHDATPGWSDFAGGVEGNDGILETAIREGTEELTGFLGSEQELREKLQKYGTYKITWNTYTTHILPMEYDESLVHYYNNNQKFLQKHLHPKVMKRYKFFEKAEIRWVPFSDLKKMRYTFRPFYKNVLDELIREKTGIEKYVKNSLKKNKKTRKNKKRMNKTRKMK